MAQRLGSPRVRKSNGTTCCTIRERVTRSCKGSGSPLPGKLQNLHASSCTTVVNCGLFDFKGHFRCFPLQTCKKLCGRFPPTKLDWLRISRCRTHGTRSSVEGTHRQQDLGFPKCQNGGTPKSSILESNRSFHYEHLWTIHFGKKPLWTSPALAKPVPCPYRPHNRRHEGPSRPMAVFFDSSKRASNPMAWNLTRPGHYRSVRSMATRESPRKVRHGHTMHPATPVGPYQLPAP